MIKVCASCGGEWEAKRASAKTCSDACRMALSRGVVAGPVGVPVVLPVSGGELTAATRAELEAADRVNTSVGQSALLIARRLDAGSESGSAVAALVREHRATLADALRGVKIAGDPLDELRAKRDAKRLA